MLTAFPNGLSSFGVPVLPNVGGLTTTGKVFFVDSNLGNNGNNGKEPTKAVATIDNAIGRCTANKGDIIFVMPGHAEDIATATAMAVDVAGISIIGLGIGDNRPTLTFKTVVGATIAITAANIHIHNLKLVSDINDLTQFIDADEDHLTLSNLHFVTSSAKEALCFVNFATTKDYLKIINCEAYQPTDPAGTDAAAGTGFLYCVDSENILLKGCKFIGNFETAIVHNKTTKCQNLVVEDCHIQCDLSTSVPLELVAAVTGHMSNSYCHVPAAADVAVANVIGTIGATFWIAPNTYFSNDSAGGGELMVNSAAACS